MARGIIGLWCVVPLPHEGEGELDVLSDCGRLVVEAKEQKEDEP